MPGKEDVAGREAGKNRRYEINFLAPRSCRSMLSYSVTAGGQSKQHGHARRQRLAQRNHIGERLIPKCHVEISARKIGSRCAWRGSQFLNQTLDSPGERHPDRGGVRSGPSRSMASDFLGSNDLTQYLDRREGTSLREWPLTFQNWGSSIYFRARSRTPRSLI
jgi:hypothetical protein